MDPAKLFLTWYIDTSVTLFQTERDSGFSDVFEAWLIQDSIFYEPRRPIFTPN